MSEPDVVISGIGVALPGAPPLRDVLARSRTSGADSEWFDTAARLGPRGYRYLPPAAQYLLAAGRAAIDDCGDGVAAEPDELRGVALGTTYGVAAVHDDLDRALVDGGPDALSPMAAPYFSVNLVATRLALENKFKAFNLTFTTPRVAGLEAISAVTRSIALGRCTVGIAAAAEAMPPPGSSAEVGAGALVLESWASAAARGAPVRGRCRVRSGAVTLRSATETASAVGRLLGGAAGRGVPAYLAAGDGPAGLRLAEAFERQGHPCRGLLDGNDGSLSAVLDVIGVLAQARGPQIVGAITPTGGVTIVLVEPAPGSESTVSARGAARARRS
jgi:3-oxoacyl-[acyl-carrier-protein] synthase II